MTALSQLVPNHCDYIYDICCDHGQIGMSLLPHHFVHFIDQIPSITEELIKRLIATDIPIRDKYKVSTESATKSQYISTNNTCYILAGIGGVLACEIISRIDEVYQDGDYILVSVHKNVIQVRNHLNNLGYRLTQELLVKDNDKYYEILLVSKIGADNITEIGSLMWQKADKLHMEYLLMQIDYYALKSKYDQKYQKYIEQYQSILQNLTSE